MHIACQSLAEADIATPGLMLCAALDRPEMTVDDNPGLRASHIRHLNV